MTAFDGWLRQLAAAKKGGSALSAADIPVAVRGQAWGMAVRLPGDRTGDVLAGAIRAAPDAGTALASFVVDTPAYDAPSNKTTWYIRLNAGTGANSTGALPADSDGDGTVMLPAMVHLTPGSSTEELLFGFAFTLIGKV